jgi:hypothetical protein
MPCRQEKQEEAEGMSPAEVQAISRLEARLERIEQMLARLLSQQERGQGGSHLAPEAQEVDRVTFAQLCSVAQRGVESDLRQVLKKYNQQRQKRGKRP